MIGNNEMNLNEATMILIVQYWLNNKFLNHDEPGPLVKAVRGDPQGGFTIKLIEAPQPAQIPL